MHGLKIPEDIFPPMALASTAMKTAKRYRERDAREEFFRPCSKSPRKRRRGTRRTKPKRHVLTDKERQRAAREHWDLHHGFNRDMPEILGHQADRQFTNPNLTMAPPRFNSLMEYFDNETVHQDNLKNLSELLDSSF